MHCQKNCYMNTFLYTTCKLFGLHRSTESDSVKDAAMWITFSPSYPTHLPWDLYMASEVAVT